MKGSALTSGLQGMWMMSPDKKLINFNHSSFYLWRSGAGIDEDSWHQVRGGPAHAVLSEAFLSGP